MSPARRSEQAGRDSILGTKEGTVGLKDYSGGAGTMLLQLKQEQSPILDVVAVYRLDTDGHVGKWIIFWDLKARWRGPAYVCLRYAAATVENCRP